MSMGYGRTALPDKVDTFGKQLRNDSNDTVEMFNKYRREVEGVGTDQSTEQAISDSPNLLGDLDRIREDINKVLREDCEMGSPEVADTRLLPNSVSTTDALHVMFKGLEYALKKNEPWAECEKGLTHIANFLRDRLLRWRFRAACCDSPETSAKFVYWQAAKIDWEYEFLERVLDPLTEVIGDLIRCYDTRKMTAATRNVAYNGEEGAGNESRKDEVKKLVKATGVALELPLLPIKCEAFRIVAKAIGRRARWFEGCHCHAEIWQEQHTSRKRKYELFRKETHLDTCIWKAKRATDMALGEIDNIKQELYAVTSPKYEELLAGLSPGERDYTVGLVRQLQDSIAEFLTAKFAHYQQLPWVWAGLDGARIGNYHGAVSKARWIVERMTAIFASTDWRKQHRKTLKLWRAHEFHIKRLARGEIQDEAEAPAMFVAIKKIALLLSATRWVEQAHAALKAILDKDKHMTPAGASATLRFPEHVTHVLHDDEARAYVAGNWNTRNMTSDRFGFAGIISGMDPAEQLRRIYRSSVGTQFRDNAAERIVTSQYIAAERAVGAGAHLHVIGDEVKLALDYIRALASERTVFSIPKEVADQCITEVGKAKALDNPLAPGIITEVTTSMKALVDKDEAAEPTPRLKRMSRFFVVVKVDPQRRFEMPVGGIGKLTCLINVTELCGIDCGRGGKLVEATPMNTPLSLDVERLLEMRRGRFLLDFSLMEKSVFQRILGAFAR
jgi:hypothetical protein